MNDLLRDVRIALKAFRRERAFSATVLLTLAVVIGANVAIFSVIQAVLLEPLPYEDPEELVTLTNSYPGAGADRASNGSFDFFTRRERVEGFEDVALLQESGSTVGDPGSAERVTTLRVTPSLFPMLRVQAALGRTFTEEEMEQGNHYRVVLSHDYWQERFASSPDAVGRTLRVDGRDHLIVGVAPEGFRVVRREDARFFLPLGFDAEDRSPESWHSNSYDMMARLRDGVTVEQARAQVDALNRALIAESPMPNAAQLLKDVGFHTLVTPTRDDLVAPVRPTLYMLWAGVAFVLLIGCVNIASLMLARSQVRRSEIATRLALGAPRGRVARQILTESLALSLIGGAVGIGVGLLGLRVLNGFGLESLPRGAEVGVNGQVLAFTALLTVGTGILFAAIPVLGVLRRDLSGVFRSEGRSTTTGRGAAALRDALVTGQVGLAFVLLAGAGLMLMSFRAALAVRPGFEAEGMLTANLSLPLARYPDADARRALLDELLREVEAVPGVSAASLTSQLPFGGNTSSSVIFPEGYAPEPGESLVSPYQSAVGPGYFGALGVTVVEGREFEWSDGPDRPQVMVVDRWLAERFWPGRSPIGQRMVANAIPGDPEISEENLYTVVGVVESVKQTDLTLPESEFVGAYYLPARQRTPGFVSLAVRARSGADPLALAPALRDIVRRLDPELPLFDVRTMEDRVAESLAGRRTPMALLLVFAGIALFLAVVGIYGALAYAVTRRTREMGIRVALGSAPGGIFRLVLVHGLRITAAGLVLGLVGSGLLGEALRTLLFGVRPLDPWVMASVAALLGAAAAAACAVPAWRATRVDPVAVLTPE